MNISSFSSLYLLDFPCFPCYLLCISNCNIFFCWWCFFLFNTVFLCVAVSIMKHSLWASVAFNSGRSISFCLRSHCLASNNIYCNISIYQNLSFISYAAYLFLGPTQGKLYLYMCNNHAQEIMLSDTL